jgi:Tat protein translocase TatB subunit
MFDIGLSELIVIGSVALIVLGPEKLAVLARSTGRLVGKAQRYMSDFKNDLARDTELSELKALKEQLESTGHDLRHAFQTEKATLEQQFNQSYTALSSNSTPTPSSTPITTNSVHTAIPNAYQASLNATFNTVEQSVLMDWYIELENLKTDLAYTEQRILKLKQDIHSVTLNHNAPHTPSVSTPPATHG